MKNHCQTIRKPIENNLKQLKPVEDIKNHQKNNIKPLNTPLTNAQNIINKPLKNINKPSK